ncbi:hypothetical protein FGG08_004925 [Glutinoglossum americanum]|uniref:DNA polymerase epsilon subunit B n=1 Tax=Glutinoglossum americanum TaxID=1670608 RepID=A0A9P8HZ80_9PEZI|nr:hypothetical protein FGG08_004925 [Glutinoglossum americanum]
MKNQKQRIAPLFRPTISAELNPIPSSSPAFGTPVHPIRAPATTTKPTILPVLLPAPTLRPVAFRTFTKKHNLTLTSSALQALATFIGKHCGAGWREEGLAERVLEEVAKNWKKLGGGVIVDGDGDVLKGILKNLEPCMSGGRIVQGSSTLSRQGSFSFGTGVGEEDRTNVVSESPALAREDSLGSLGLPGLEANDDEEDEGTRDPRKWLKVIRAFDQPQLVYNGAKRHFERATTKPTLLPAASQKTHLFRHRYALIQQRLLRHDSFQPLSFSRTTSPNQPQPYKLTPIANLLGRHNTPHLLLGLLTISPTGTLALSDPTGSIALDLRHATPVPEEGVWFVPGMIVLVDGLYEEEYNSAGGALGGGGGVGGTIGGKFIGFSVGGPPCEKREATLGIGFSDTSTTSSVSGAFGWVDFLGVGSERAVGSKMRLLSQRILTNPTTPPPPTRLLFLSTLHLDNPRTHLALRTILSIHEKEPTPPLAIILLGPFISQPSLSSPETSKSSITYKESFNHLASTLSDFPALLANSKFIFVPGDNDPWASAAAGGASTTIPREGVPEVFTGRVRRAFATARGGEKGGGGEAIWTTNPARLSLFGPVKEVVLFRDDIASRFRRNAITFPPKPTVPSTDMEIDPPQSPPSKSTPHTLLSTLLPQSHLSPFPLSTRPQHWSHSSALSLYPLPTALVLADAETEPFVLGYEGCCVLNPGALIEGRKARWCEYDVSTEKGVVREENF